jgi:hypothetical protein
MPTDDRDDPGADTAMFRAYVEEPGQRPAAAPEANRTLIIGLVVAIVVLVLVGLVVLV